MENIHSEFIKPERLLEKYEEKFYNRYNALLTDMNEFVKGMGCEDSVRLDRVLLGNALMDYFEDIERLKIYHHLEHVNAIKIVSHTAYWLLKRHPIQIVKPSCSYMDINERFILMYILDFLSGNKGKKILDRDETGLLSFNETLLFFLKYRISSPDMIELAITGFFAGQIFQEEKCDISASLGKIEKQAI